MGRADFFKGGDYNAICDYCGFKFKASQLRRTWDGYMACQVDWSPRNAQDFVRGVRDQRPLPWTRPEAPDTFITYCTTASAIPGVAIPGCAIPGNTSIPDLVPPSTF